MSDLPAEVDRFSARRVLLVSTHSAKPIVDDVLHHLGSRVVATIPETRAHTPRQDVDRARAEARASKVDLVLTLGGGSATGIGKAIVLEHPAPLVAIPTTYAGSEVTSIYGITESGRKRTGRDTRVLPRTVLYDPQLTTSLPARVTAATGMNAIAHCVEALYAENAGPMTGAMAQEAIRALHATLPACIENPEDKTARTGALYGAYLAGSVLATTGMAIHHRICHVLGGTFGLPHGDVNAVVLPHAVAFNEPTAQEAIELVAEALGADAAARALFDLSVSLGAPTSLRELGMKKSDLEQAASLVVDARFYNPRPVDFDQVLQILHAAFEGRRPETQQEWKEQA